MEIVPVAILAVVVLPFGVGWWIGHPVFGAAVFLAMSLTVLLGSVSRGGTDGSDPGVGLAVSLAVSSASAYAGGLMRERRRKRDT